MKARPDLSKIPTNLPIAIRRQLGTNPAYMKPPVIRVDYLTNSVFDHFLAESLGNAVSTNFIAHTNGRTLDIWTTRSHPPGWPARPPLLRWNTNSIMWGMKGLTGLSPCSQCEPSPGQVPITALTRRHGYTRGHSMGEDGFRTKIAGYRVWFLATNNEVVEVRVLREVVRTAPSGRDYTLLLFDRDLPISIEPFRVTTSKEIFARYPVTGGPWVLFHTEQGGRVSAQVDGFSVETWKGGDSGSPDLLPLPGELVFYGGRSTSGPSPEMQADMDELCRRQGLDPNKYQLNWVDLSTYPSYAR